MPEQSPAILIDQPPTKPMEGTMLVIEPQTFPNEQPSYVPPETPDGPSSLERAENLIEYSGKIKEETGKHPLPSHEIGWRIGSDLVGAEIMTDSEYGPSSGSRALKLVRREASLADRCTTDLKAILPEIGTPTSPLEAEYAQAIQEYYFVNDAEKIATYSKLAKTAWVIRCNREQQKQNDEGQDDIDLLERLLGALHKIQLAETNV